MSRVRIGGSKHVGSGTKRTRRCYLQNGGESFSACHFHVSTQIGVDLYPKKPTNTVFIGFSRDLRTGFFPTCAGRPRPSSRSSASGKVYPRACGASFASWRRRRFVAGLSLPRARVGGTVSAETPLNGRLAAAPARGQRSTGGRHVRGRGLSPRVRGGLGHARRIEHERGVDPRACGGNRVTCRRVVDARGLSPRARGSAILRPSRH